MRRTYDRDRYLTLVAKLRDAIPGLALGTDIIVGFPGETEADFRETLAVVEEVRYDSAFTFIYSPRQGTEAAAMADQVPEEVKHERLERLVDVVQRIAAEKNAARVGQRRGGARRGREPHGCDAPARPHARQRHRQLRRQRPAGRARRRPDRERHLDDAARRAASGGGGVKVLLTGSSGQIGTNLALRLLADGHEVFGVDQRVNTWTDEFRYLIQDLSGQYPAFPDGIGGVPYPETDVVVHLAAHAKVHQLVAHPHRALENTMMTFNVLEYCRQRRLPLVFSSTREVYGDVHRFEGYGEETADFAFTESPYSASKIASEAFIYAYARCYGLKYLAFRFSNVYGRYDNDLHRMSRVLPLFIHSMSRDEPITVFGGADKVLDFTYVDDCVDGISRGIEALVDGRVTNETINLAFGEGNTLVRAAELIAAELDVEPKMTIAPSLLGEVTRYVADIRKAHDLLGWTPQVPLDEGIPRAVAWFQEHRAAHPEEDKPVVNEGDSVGWKTARSRPLLASSRIFGPTASGKTAVAEAIAERIPAELVSADSMQVYRGLPILTNQDAGARLVGIWPLDRQGTVGEYQQLAHAAIDEIAASGRTPIVVGGSGLWFQAALTDVELPADVPAGARARWERLYDRRGAETAHAILERRDPRAAARVHANDRKRVVRALELWQAGGTLVPEQPRLWTAELRLPALVVGLDASRETLAARIRRTHSRDVRAGGGGRSARRGGRRGAAGARPARRVADAAARGGDRRARARHAAASPPTSASGCAGSRASS